MFTFAFAAKLFEGFSVLRWNDRLRPIEFTEMDRHALKSAITYIVGKEEEVKSTEKINWLKIVEGNIYDLFRKIATSDIHSTVSSMIKKDPIVHAELNKYILRSYETRSMGLPNLFLDGLRKYLANGELNSLESNILYFGHKYSTKREFDIIKRLNATSDLTQISNTIMINLNKMCNLAGTKDLLEENGNNYELLCVIEKLRYQTRWSQTPRVPSTSVLGHSMYVAVLVYFLSLELNACNQRIVNNFYAALFHDLPESLTRDIISPVKRSSHELDEQIKLIEIEMCQEYILNHVNNKWRFDLEYLLLIVEQSKIKSKFDEDSSGAIRMSSEFSNRIIQNNEIYTISSRSMQKYNEDTYSPIDGELIELCDKIATFMEAYMSIHYGIISNHLENGKNQIRNRYAQEVIQGINISDFFGDIV